MEADIATADFILKLLEKEEHLAAAWKAARKTVKITDALLDGFLTFGLSHAAMAFSTLRGSRERAATIAGRYFSPERTP